LAVAMTRRGYFSVLRWRNDATRDEARNVAVLLVDEDGEFGGLRAAPLSTISPRLKEQGLLDQMLIGLRRRFETDQRPTLATLKEMCVALQHSVYLTQPRRVAVADVDAVLDALYRAYAAPQGGGPRTLTKGYILDRVVDTLRRNGLNARRGEYVGDFLFDVVVDGADSELPPLIEVLSFASPRKEWSGAEYDAGHFLFALERVQRKGMAVVQPPKEASQPNAGLAYERVMRWFKSAHVPTPGPEEFVQLTSRYADPQPALPLAEH